MMVKVIADGTEQDVSKHEVKVTNRGRANVGGLKISEYFGAIEEIPDDISPKEIVDAVFVVAGVIHPKAMIDKDHINIDSFINFSIWLDIAVPWSRIGKYQRIKRYNTSLASGARINVRNVVNN